MVDLNPTISMLTLSVNDLNTDLKADIVRHSFKNSAKWDKFKKKKP